MKMGQSEIGHKVTFSEDRIGFCAAILQDTVLQTCSRDISGKQGPYLFCMGHADSVKWQ